MARPTVTYDAVGGDDTGASGAGPGTAISGTAAAHTNDGPDPEIRLVGAPDLSGVDTTGLAVLWLDNGTGNKHLHRITAVNNVSTPKTVTIVDSYTITIAGAVDYAIGGARKSMTFGTREDWEDAEAGWIFEFEDGTYNVVKEIGPTVGDATDGPVTFRAAAGHAPVFDISDAGAGGDIRHFKYDNGRLVLDGLKATRSAGAHAANALVLAQNGADTLVVRRCSIDGLSAAVLIGGACAITIDRCDFGNATGSTISQANFPAAAAPNLVISRTSIHGGVDGIKINTSSAVKASVFVDRCLIYDMSGDGISHESMDVVNQLLSIVGCTIDNCDNGINVVATPSVSSQIILRDNAITNNATWGITMAGAAPEALAINANNLYYNNGGGGSSHRQNVDAGADDIVGSDPLYVDTTPGSENYTPKATSPLIGAGSADITG